MQFGDNSKPFNSTEDFSSSLSSITGPYFNINSVEKSNNTLVLKFRDNAAKFSKILINNSIQ